MQSPKGVRRKRIAVAIAHVALWPVLSLIQLFRRGNRPRPLGEKPRILLARIDGIGDLAMSAAIFPSLRRRYPEAHIDLLTSDACRSIAELFVEAKWIDSVQVMPRFGRGWKRYRALADQIRAANYDAALDLRGDARTVFSMWLARVPNRLGLRPSGLTFLLTDVIDIPAPAHEAAECAELIRHLGVSDIDRWPVLPLTDADRAYADQWLTEHGADSKRLLIGFHLGGSVPCKLWPMDRFVEAARHLQEHYNTQIIVFGGKDELSRAQEFSARLHQPAFIAVGGVPLRGVTALLSRCALFIGNDSGPAHLSAGAGAATIVIFSPTFAGVEEVYQPLSPRTTILRLRRRCDPRCGDECATPQTWCMLEHRVETVIDAAEKAIKK